MMDIVAGAVFGIGGSLHCAGMCGPLALALPVGSAERLRYLAGRLLYNVGRLLTYMLLGCGAGIAGRGIVLAGAQQVVSIAIGVVLLLSVSLPLVPGWRFLSFAPHFRPASVLVQALSHLRQRSSPAGMVLIGMLNGMLPCGFVYMGLAAAVTLGAVLRSMAFMTGFGLGTLPVMLVIAYAGRGIQEGVRRKLTWMVPAVTVALALLLVLRGMNLGIPYLSPLVRGQGAVEQHCH